MKKKYLILTVILAVLVMGASIGGTMSYFTTYCDAKGGLPIRLGYSTRIKEEFSGKEKRVAVVNEAGSVPVAVRAKVFYADDVEPTISGTNWTQTLPANWKLQDGDEDYWYYTGILNAEDPENKEQAETDFTTEILSVKFEWPEDPQQGDNFDIVIVYESTPVKYMEDGTPYADWSTILDIRRSEGGTQ